MRSVVVIPERVLLWMAQTRQNCCSGGPHVSYWTEEALSHVDVVVTGEAESVWPEVLRDLERGTARRVYRGGPVSLAGLPTPRYDLLEDRFLVPRVLQATRHRA